MITLFLGPTLDAAAARSLLPEALILPPAAQGDVFRACSNGARVIAIVDGYFESVPAVWHKEILWAMSQGVHVYGAASMGALRASELADFGMVGVGEVYERFRRGDYERDDEVAIIHGDADSGYRAMSVALVDIRATLERAELEGVIDADESRRLLDDSAAAYYPERTWHRLALAVERVCPAQRRERVVAWLFVNAVAQKQADARALLLRLLHDQAACQSPKQVDYHFEYTEFWRLAAQRDGRWGASSGLDRSEALLDELRLEGVERYAAAAQSGHERSQAVEQALQQGFQASVDQIEAVWAELIARHGLDSTEKRRAWCHERGLSGEEFLRFLREEAAVLQARQHRSAVAPRAILDHLRLEGSYPELSRRAREKQARAAEVELAEPGEAELLSWYYEQRLGAAVPEDLAEQAHRLELSHREVWLDVLRREFRQQQRLAKSSEETEPVS